MDSPIGFGIVDYVVIGASLLVCVFIPFFTQPKKSKDKHDFIYGKDEEENDGTVDEYLLGSRKMSVIPVAFSITATLLSANSMTGTTGEIFINGMQFLLMIIGFIIGQLLVSRWIVPVLHNIKIVSIYEYIEMRFDATLRMMFSVVFLFINLIINGVFLFAPAISFTTISGLPYWITSTITGTICTLYCISGGLKAVIWADVFQTVLIFVSTIMIAVQGVIDGGGFVAIFHKTFEGRMEDHFTLTEDFSKGYSIWAVIVFGIVSCLWGTVSSQAGAQRLLAVKNAKDAQRALVLSMVMLILFEFVIIVAAVAIFAKFTDCNPLQRPETGVMMPDQLLIYATAIMLGSTPGLLGIAMAGLISAALSTISSYINAFAACTLEDYLKPYCPNLTNSDRKNLIICKVLTAFYGAVSVGLSLAVPHLGGIVRVLFAIIGALSGPFTGILFLAFFFPRANTNACKIAVVSSLAFSLWISIGALVHPTMTTGIVHSLEGCPVSNYSVVESIMQGFGAITNSTLTNSTITNATMLTNEWQPLPEEDVFILYKISVMWIQTISTGAACIIAIILSFIFGLDKEPDPKLLSPLVAPKNPPKVRRQTRDDIIRKDEALRLSMKI